jgi:hypothetical protein
MQWPPFAEKLRGYDQCSHLTQEERAVQARGPRIKGERARLLLG